MENQTENILKVTNNSQKVTLILCKSSVEDLLKSPLAADAIVANCSSRVIFSPIVGKTETGLKG